MDRESDVRKIVAGGRARGLSDDQIRALVARYDARTQAPPPDSGPSDADKILTAIDPMNMAKSLASQVGMTALVTAMPLAGRVAGAVPGVIGRALTAASNVLDNPLVGGAIGAAQGAQRNGAQGAIEGGLMGAAGGKVLGKAMGAVGRKMAPPPSLNAGGRLVPRQTPTVTESLDDALQSMRGPQPTTAYATPGIVQPMPTSVQSVRLPTAPPGPSVTYSPKAKAAATGRTPPSRGTSSDLGSGAERMYQELARKPILTPEEQQIFDRLHAVMGKQASHIGRSYAARGGR